MTAWQEIVTAVILALLVLIFVVRSSVRKAREQKWRAAERKLETVLQPKETVKALCPSREGRWILTSKRLLRETRGGFTALELKTVKRVQGNTKEGKTTTVPAKMVSLTVKADKDHTIRNTAPEFTDFARQLQDKVKKQNQKKKAQKEKKSRAD
nr:hypothetical protein [Oscillospiraceae bacterium]